MFLLKSTIPARGIIHISIILAWVTSTSAWASGGYIYDAVGEVSIAVGKNATHRAVKNDVIPTDTVVNTGDKSYAVLKFEDGQVATMQADTAFHVREYRYDPQSSERSNIIFSKFKGGMLFITGLIGQRNHKAFRLATPNATIGIRGTEFMVVTVNDTLYSKVISGSISMTNEAGMAIFNAGQTILVASPNTLPMAIPEAALPAGIFSQLEAIPTPPGIVESIVPTTTVPEVPAVGTTLPLAIPAVAPPAGAISSTPLPSGAVPLPLGTPPLPSVGIPLPVPTVPAAPSATTISLTGSGAHYTAAHSPCDFCTGRSKTVPTHIAPPPDTTGENTVTGEADLFGKHNLTPTGANTGEICAFCHTPQGSENTVAAPPLWNRTAPTLSSYRAFSTMGSATPEATGSISMSCLSCHDGTQAPNIVINTPNNKLDVPEGEIVDIGNDLKNHHPVGMPYAGGEQNQNAPDIPLDPIAAYNQLAQFNGYTSGNKFSFYNRRGIWARLYSSSDVSAFADVDTFSNAGNFSSPKGGFNKSTYSGTGSSTVWWVEPPHSKRGRQKTDLYLFTRTDTVDSVPGETTISQPYVECATCHDPHSTNSTFLRLPGGNVRSQICLTCHNK